MTGRKVFLTAEQYRAYLYGIAQRLRESPYWEFGLLPRELMDAPRAGIWTNAESVAALWLTHPDCPYPDDAGSGHDQCAGRRAGQRLELHPPSAAGEGERHCPSGEDEQDGFAQISPLLRRTGSGELFLQSNVREFRTNGPVTKTLIPMAALDDMVGVAVFLQRLQLLPGTSQGAGYRCT